MKPLASVSTLAFFAMAAPALADVTPQQVWDDLEAYMQGFGYSVEGAEAMSGDTLTVSDVTLGMPIPESDGQLEFGMQQVMFTDRGDGTVSVTFPASMPISFKGDIDGDELDMVLDYTHDGLEMIVSGSAEEMSYDYSAASLAIALSKLVVDGDVITRDMARLVVTMNGVAGNSQTILTDGLRNIAQTMSVSDLTIDAAASEPGGEEGGSLVAKMAGVTTTSNGLIPEGLDYSDPMVMMNSGLAGVAEIRHSGGDVQFLVTENSGSTSGSLTTSSGVFKFGMSGDELTYEAGNTDMAFSMAGPEIPFPINAEMAETSFKVSMPLQASDTPQDASIGITLGGFKTSDLLWGLFDPAAILPRDPATVSADLTAKVTPFVSLFDEKAMTELGRSGEAPGELNQVTLNSLLVEAAGGKISGDGAFTFDNSDLESFDGMPRPEGTLNLSVSGANGLIDKVIEMGFITPEDAMGARMMLSMFTVPGAEPDTATSKIEVNAQGHVLANGQRLK